MAAPSARLQISPGSLDYNGARLICQQALDFLLETLALGSNAHNQVSQALAL
jgi:hypothetical protein